VALSKLIVALSLAAAGGLMLAVSSAVLTKEDPAARGKKTFFDYSAATGNIEPVADSPPVTPRLVEHGRWVFRGLCIGCHGPNGDGKGAVWELGDKYAKMHKLPRKPRDFTAAVFKVRSTPSGSLPTDKDLFRAVSRGLVADQDMPAFKFLPERDRWAVIAYIKTLSKRWEEEKDYQEPGVTVGEPPIPDAATIQAGKLVYAEMKCAKCHGELGKGDGPSAPELTDDNGLSIKPRDFSDPGQFVGANDPRGIYQTFTTGLDGTPMPTFADFLPEDKRWQLVWYVMSLRPSFDLDKTRQEMQRERGGKVAQSGANAGK
jgi:cytochrome c oxidase cbb3-type subunit 2